MLIRELLEPTAETKAALLKAAAEHHGGLRWPLPNMEPVEEWQFWRWRIQWGFKAEAYAGQREIQIGENRTWATVLLYWADHSDLAGGGFAVAVARHGRVDRPFYFRWRACAHEFTESRPGAFRRVYTCSRCGYAYETDSSG